ncbi:MAG: radical SAM protein [Firmicutes bacterium]|nr:radical SAM protein [Bacillota bacterium]
MKVLLINPPRHASITDTIENLGLGYIASGLRRAGHEVTLLDASIENLSIDAVVERALEGKPGLIGISILFQLLAEIPLNLTRSLKRSLKQAGLDVHITTGGHFPTFAFQEILNGDYGVDSVVRGEGDVTIIELARALEEGRSLETVSGLAYREGEEIVPTAPRELVPELDSLQLPARDWLAAVLRRGGKACISTSRGCYGNCSFCSIRAFYGLSPGRVWRARSPEGVLEEMMMLARDFGVDDMWVVDDTFIGPGRLGRERAARIAELLIRENARGPGGKPGIALRISCRADEVDRELFALLKRAGVKEVFLGIESGVQRALDIFNKGTTVEQNERAIRTLRDLDVDFSLGFILLHPYTTFEELSENLSFLRRVGYPLSRVPISPTDYLPRLQVLVGTPIAERLRQEGRLGGSLFDYAYEFDDPRVRVYYKTGAFLRRRILPLQRAVRRLVRR